MEIKNKSHDQWFEILLYLYSNNKENDKHITKGIEMIEKDYFKNIRRTRDEMNSLRVIFLTKHLDLFEKYLQSTKKFKKSEILKKTQECTYTDKMSFSLFTCFTSYLSISFILIDGNTFFTSDAGQDHSQYFIITKENDQCTILLIENKNEFYKEIEKMEKEKIEIKKIGRPIDLINQYTMNGLYELFHMIKLDKEGYKKKTEMYEMIKKQIPCYFYEN